MFTLARPGLLEAINPEMQALFRAVIYAFSIWVNKQTPGNMFMNLVFANGHAPATPYPRLRIPLTSPCEQAIETDLTCARHIFHCQCLFRVKRILKIPHPSKYIKVPHELGASKSCTVIREQWETLK